MRRFEAEGTKYKLTEKEYAQLLRRFDVNNITDGEDKKVINKSCICESEGNCMNCNLGPHSSGCIRILIGLNLQCTDIYLSSNRLVLDGDDAYSQLSAIHEFLLTMEKVK